VRPLEQKDLANVLKLIKNNYRKFQVKPLLFEDEEAAARLLQPGQQSFVQSFVVADFDTDEATDLFAFYKCQTKEEEAPACRELITVAGRNEYICLMKLAQAKALEEGYQSILSTDAMENVLVLHKLGFVRANVPGAFLYFYNWNIPIHLNSDSVAWQPNIY
jgi:hypothetical protein